MSENILEVKGLTKDYGDFVLDKLTFSVPRGVIMGLVGENGAVKSTEDVPVTVTVTGAGRLQALGSAKPNMGECFFSDTHTTYYGNALAVIRVGTTSGKIQVKVSAPGLENQFVELDVQP